MVILFTFAGSAKWKNTQGEVKSISIEEIKVRDSNSSGVKRTLTSHKVNILYEYDIESKKYSNDVILEGFPNIYDRKIDADEQLNKYKNQAEITVYYNPKNPQQSALITAKEVPKMAFVVIFIMLSLIAGAFYAVLKSGIFKS